MTKERLVSIPASIIVDGPSLRLLGTFIKDSLQPAEPEVLSDLRIIAAFYSHDQVDTLEIYHTGIRCDHREYSRSPGFYKLFCRSGEACRCSSLWIPISIGSQNSQLEFGDGAIHAIQGHFFLLQNPNIDLVVKDRFWIDSYSYEDGRIDTDTSNITIRQSVGNPGQIEFVLMKDGEICDALSFLGNDSTGFTVISGNTGEVMSFKAR